MEIEPELQLALALYSSPGVYALLLGSGISSSAGVKTGWQITLDLVRKLAASGGDVLGNDEEAEKWYKERFSESPNYSKLLDALAPTSSERQQLLYSYFEPTEEERNEGEKVPTEAYRAIARLVRQGTFRLILTTNFDKLLEQALQDVGTQPDVISSSYDLMGAIPYIHSEAFLVKLHGDYRDVRIRNTESELSQYPEEIDKFLDEVLDRFGLVICGWSADWDIALREAILRSPNRRFTTYWLARSEPSEQATRVIAHRQAKVISISSAEQAFVDMEEKLTSLDEMNRPHPLSVEEARATVERYVAEEKYRVRLHNLLHEETESVFQAAVDAPTEVVQGVPLHETFQKRLRDLESIAEKLLCMVRTLARFDEGRNVLQLTRCVERLLQLRLRQGSTALLHLQEYPAMLVMYTAGVAALAASSFHCLYAAICRPRFRQRDIQQRVPVAAWLNPGGVIEHRLLPSEYRNRWTPCSDYLADAIRPQFLGILPDEQEYLAWFDILQYVLALTHIDLTQDGSPHVGSFSCRYLRRQEGSPVSEFIAQGLASGEEWELLRSGFFDGDSARLKRAIEVLEERTSHLLRGFH